MSLRQRGRVALSSVRLLLPFAIILALAAIRPAFLFVPLLGSVLYGWYRLVDYDYVSALVVFLTLVPLWTYLKWAAWPALQFGGSTFYVATVLKELLLIVFFLHWLVRSYRSGSFSLRLSSSILAYFAVVSVALLQAGLVRYPFLVRPYVEMLLLVTVPLLSIELTDRDVYRLLAGLTTGGAITAAFALYHAFGDPNFLITADLLQESVFKTKPGGISAFFGSRLQSFTGNPNTLGLMMLLTSLLSFGFLFDTEDRDLLVRAGFGVLFALSAVALMLTRSRDDIGLFAVGLALFVVLYRRKTPLALGSLVFAGAMFLNLDQILGYFLLLLEHGNPRFEIWAAGVEFYGFDLLHGVGYVDRRFLTSNPFDSTYFRILIQTGVVGLGLFLWINARLLLGLLADVLERGIQTVPITLFVLITVMLGTFAFMTGLFFWPFTLYYWLLIALAVRYLSEDESSGGDVLGTAVRPVE